MFTGAYTLLFLRRACKDELSLSKNLQSRILIRDYTSFHTLSTLHFPTSPRTESRILSSGIHPPLSLGDGKVSVWIVGGKEVRSNILQLITVDAVRL